MRIGYFFFAAFAILALGTAAVAHAFLDRAVPPVGASVAAPAEARLWFSERLDPASSRVEVFDGLGARVDKGDSAVDPADARQLRVSLLPLPAGTYKVVWRAVAVDTHASRGNYKFQVKGESR